MKILIIGFVVFVIWSLFSVWLYVEKIKPVLNAPVAIQSIPETQAIEADSAMQSNALFPSDLTVYFEFDDARFITDPQIDKSLINFETWLEKNPESMLSIMGHTDILGTSEYNQALGLKRAQSIQEYLESKGVYSNKIISDSKGEDQPVVDQTTEEGRAKNRRAVITIK